jgi:hypothetical protein
MEGVLSDSMFVPSFVFIIAFLWLVYTNIQMTQTLKSMRKMMALQIALEADRETTLKSTRIDKNVSNFSDVAIERKGSTGKESVDLFLDWIQRLF